jgi:nicotinamide mononucleotide transporter
MMDPRVPTALEIAANVFNAASIVLAARNNLHTWWTGIVGCALFGLVFVEARLYADFTLQIFFIGACAAGWWTWTRGRDGAERPVTHATPRSFAMFTLAAATAAAGYAWLLHRFTNSVSPIPDSLVLAFSVLGQLLLVRRQYESWWCWLLVNTIAVPLYASRGLWLTSALYVIFWINGVVALRRWRRLVVRTAPVLTVSGAG